MIFKELSPGPGEMEQLITLSEAWAAEGSCYGYVANGASDFENERIFAALKDTAIVGYLYGHVSIAKNIQSIIMNGVPYFSIEEFYVSPPYRSKGIGSALFGFVQDRLFAEGLRYILLTTATKDHDAIRRFYVDKVGMTPWSMTLYKELSASNGKTQNVSFHIVPFENQYRDDLIFMVLEAKNALGRVPTLNGDLLDINSFYFNRGDRFWIALDENNRVVGCIGYSSIENSTEVFLHRLFVKPEHKRKGIGSALLETAETHLKAERKTAVHVHLGEPKEMWFESYAFYPKHGYTEYAPRYMRKDFLDE